MLRECERFIRLFDQLVRNTNEWIALSPAEKLDWKPIDNPRVRLSDRMPTITIRGVYVHMTISEHHWVRDLRDCADGALIPIPHDDELTAKLAASDFVSETMRMHRQNMDIVAGFDEKTLSKTIRYADVTRSAMEFLWNIYAHRAHHLGHIDLYLRQANTEPPVIYPF